MLGAWWSYEVLGWGGYWAWDPVENASFLPWLTGTAFLHSVMVQERRGMLRVWNLALVLRHLRPHHPRHVPHPLGRARLGARLHRVAIGPMLLAFFALVVLVTCGLIAWRGDRAALAGAHRLAGQPRGRVPRQQPALRRLRLRRAARHRVPARASRRSAATASRVGEPYFDRMAMPIGLALLFLMAVAPVLPWRKASAETLAARLHWPAWIGAAASCSSVLLGARGSRPLLAFGLGGFAAGSAVRQVVLATRRQGWRGLVGRTNGGMIVHLGVVLIAVALAASQSYATESRVTLAWANRGRSAGHTSSSSAPQEETSRARVRKAQVRIDGGQVYAPAISAVPERRPDDRHAVGAHRLRRGRLPVPRPGHRPRRRRRRPPGDRRSR